MSHDKIRNAARKRMAETGEPYSAARRAVIMEQQQAASKNRAPGTRWFAISYSDAWEGRLSAWLDARLFRAGRGVSGVEVDADEIRVRMGSFKLDVPRASVRSIERSQAKVGRTTGVHGRRGGGWSMVPRRTWSRSQSSRPVTPRPASIPCSASARRGWIR